jgi:pyrroline-5-carboxylate reductase
VLSPALENGIAVDLVVVGGGKMGEALIGGLLNAGHSASTIVVIEPFEVRRHELTQRYAGLAVLATIPADLRADGALIAVKPQHVAEVCRDLAPKVNRILSIAAGVRIATMEQALSEGAPGRNHPVIRSMPNTPALVGAGASAITGGTHASADDMAWASGILGAVGVVEQVDEKLLDAVTGLSGSGPAYIFLVAEALIEGGVAAGLPRNVAVSLASQTIYGAGKLLAESTDDAATLRANVTSPGGTTAAGLRSLESHGVRSAFIEAVAAATARSHELG